MTAPANPQPPDTAAHRQRALSAIYSRALQRAREAEEAAQAAEQAQAEAAEHGDIRKEPGDQPGSENARLTDERQTTTTPTPY